MFVPLQVLSIYGEGVAAAGMYDGPPVGSPFKEIPRFAINATFGVSHVWSGVIFWLAVSRGLILFGAGSMFSSWIGVEFSPSLFLCRTFFRNALLYFFTKSSGTCRPSLM